MTIMLDCSSEESAFKSVSTAFSCTEEALKSVLLSIDLNEIYESDDDICIPCEEYLYNYVTKRLGEPRPFSSVVWFHGTRTSKQNSFENGVFPLNDSLNRVWDILLLSAPNRECRENLEFMRTNGVDDYLYGLRVNGSIHWGPYGILVRDVAFNTSKLSQHDYLGMPELVEDILNAYKKQFGICLYSHYEKVLVPKLVKFQCTSRLDDGCIEAALGYLYARVRGEQVNGMSVTCIDMSGVAITPSQIMAVETVSP
ncbi:hypothetical protein [Vibrio alginolyticus]|uniref:hypothetical protein n=1 Tax=Vibrio alginolyticus TaxID=663 RepID=UPI0018EF21E8|nr:hypothetical protein [Vibrio alginolyticus]